MLKLALSDYLESSVAVESTWLPRISMVEFFEFRYGVDFWYEDWKNEGYKDNIMKAFEENRYGRD